MNRRPKSREIYKFNQERPTIGLFIESASDMGQGYYPDILAGVAATIETLDANLFCFTGGCFYGVPDILFDDQRNILYEVASPDNLDGLIIVSSIGNYAPSEEIRNLYPRYAPLPTVTIGTPINGTPTVTVDNRKGMIDTMAHLIEVHHYRRIAFIRGPEDSPDAEIRYQVYKDMLTRYAIPFDPNLVVPGLFRFISGMNAIRTLMDERQVEFDAIIGANDHMALGALGELQARGFVVPYDVAVTGFDNIHQTRNIVPPITTVGQPLFQLGEKAVHILLARIAGEEVPEQTILPTELVVRRSCGCLKTQVSVNGSQPVGFKTIYESLAQCLSLRRDAILADLVEMVDFAVSPGQDGAVLLLDSFIDEVVHGENGRFIKTIDRLLRVIIAGDGHIVSWQSVVAVLRDHIMFSFRQDVISAQASTLLYEAQVFISGEIRNVEAQGYLRTDRQNWLLHDIGQMLITTLEMEGLMDGIAESIRRLEIPGCYLVFYEDPEPYSYPQAPPEWSHLIMACNENGRIPLNPAHQRFPTRILIPTNTLPQERRFAMMVQPLYFREEQIGYILLERGPHEGNIYEVLHGQIASALKGALLLQAHKHAEAELRKHRDHLDEMVQDRTLDVR